MRIARHLSRLLLIWVYPVLLISADQIYLPETWLIAQNATGPFDKVAIIGSGMTGSSVAFELSRLVPPSEAVQIDLFEASPRVGGQIMSVMNPDSDWQTIELGAAAFSKADTCLNQSLAEVGLRSYEIYPYVWKTQGIWDGIEVKHASSRSQCNWSKLSWADQARLVWRYGWPIHHLAVAIEETSATWNRPHNVSVFRNISDMLTQKGYEGNILGTAKRYFDDISVSSDVAGHYAETCTRQAFWTNLNESRALSSLMSMNNHRLSRVEGGNIRLIEQLIDQSGVNVHTNKTVNAVVPGWDRRYKIDIVDENTDKDSLEYDTIIIATSITSSGIDLSSLYDMPAIQHSHEEYHDDVWVTVFVTPATLVPAFFGLAGDTPMPDDLFTTRYKPSSNYSGPEIISITRYIHRWLDSSCQFDDECDQFTEANRYHVVSRTEVNETMLRAMVGVDSSPSMQSDDVDEDRIEDIHWIRSTMWPGVVKKYVESADGQEPGLNQSFKLMKGLYYAGGGDKLVASLEMACRIGKNVARLAWEDSQLESYAVWMTP